MESLKFSVLNPQTPLALKIRTLFTLRNHEDQPTASLILCDLLNKTDSPLLRHEIAYILGQMSSPNCVNALCEYLLKTTNCEVARHECAEALGNLIYTEETANILLKVYKEETSLPVKESCYLALRKLEEFNNLELLNEEIKIPTENAEIIEFISSNYSTKTKEKERIYLESDFTSKDPALPFTNNKNVDLKLFRSYIDEIYINKQFDLYLRYKAMFNLRNFNDKNSIEILGGDSFRNHQIYSNMR